VQTHSPASTASLQQCHCFSAFHPFRHAAVFVLYTTALMCFGLPVAAALLRWVRVTRVCNVIKNVRCQPTAPRTTRSLHGVAQRLRRGCRSVPRWWPVAAPICRRGLPGSAEHLVLWCACSPSCSLPVPKAFPARTPPNVHLSLQIPTFPVRSHGAVPKQAATPQGGPGNNGWEPSLL